MSTLQIVLIPIEIVVGVIAGYSLFQSILFIISIIKPYKKGYHQKNYCQNPQPNQQRPFSNCSNNPKNSNNNCGDNNPPTTSVKFRHMRILEIVILGVVCVYLVDTPNSVWENMILTLAILLLGIRILILSLPPLFNYLVAYIGYDKCWNYSCQTYQHFNSNATVMGKIIIRAIQRKWWWLINIARHNNYYPNYPQNNNTSEKHGSHSTTKPKVLTTPIEQNLPPRLL